jgi:hypothetical protein
LCEGPYLELFARRARPGWDGWGLEAGLAEGRLRPRRWASNSYPGAPGAAERPVRRFTEA